MATSSEIFSALNAGSGVDVAALAKSLVEAEKAPQQESIQNKIDKQERRISGYSAVMFGLENLRSAFAELNDATDFNSLSAAVSHTSALAVSVGASAQPAYHELTVTQIAKPQISTGPGFATATTAINGGSSFSLGITIGGVAVAPIKIAAADTTPQGVVDAINDADNGLTASLVNTGTGATPYQIVIKGAEGTEAAYSLSTDDGTGSGETQLLTFGAATASGDLTVAGVTVAVTNGDTAAEVAAKVRAALVGDAYITGNAGRSVTDNGDGTLSLAFSALDNNMLDVEIDDGDSTGVTMSVSTSSAFVAGSALGDLNFGTTVQAAQDAQLTYDGISVTRGSNNITDLISGATLVLTAPTPAGETATINLSRNVTPIKEKIQALVEMYNTTMSDFDTLMGQASDDPEDVYSGSLAGDSLTRSIKNQVRAMMSDESSTKTDSIAAMRDLGFEIDRYGVASINETTLDSALRNSYDDVVTMFSADTTNQSDFGEANRGLAGDAIKSIKDLLDTRGTILTQSTNAESKIEAYREKLTDLERRMESLLARYTKQFAVMESFVGQTNSMRDSLKTSFEGLMAMYTNK
jgi:flagellar hook-associated protein 2